MGKSIHILLTILSFLVLTQSSRILLVIDSPLIEQTHTKFIKTLQSFSTTGSIDIAKPTSAIQLKKYDRFSYDHIVVLGFSHKQLQSNLKVNQILNYFDQGGNVILVGDIDTSKSYRKLFRSFGVELDQYGSKIKDHFNNLNRSDVIKTSNYVGAPFLDINKPILYQGVGLNLVNFENYQLYELISSEPTAFIRNYISEQTTRIGRISLVAGVQGLNNARGLLVGSLGFFSDTAFEESDFSNENAAIDLLSWTFKQKGVIRVTNMYYHGEGAQTKQTVFNVGQKIYFQTQVQSQRGSEWIPYNTEDLQIQFVMLDPWVRVPLVQVNNTSIYKADFYAPGKQGIYQFKVIYKRPGYSFITESERVTLRPYKHDEYQRFLFVASPYFFGLFATICGTFIFALVYLYSIFKSTKKIKKD